jgi:hypothetical protein
MAAREVREARARRHVDQHLEERDTRRRDEATDPAAVDRSR